MRAAVEGWRRAFGDRELPFFNVELAACNSYPTINSSAIVWAPIRQASRSFLSLPGTSGFITAIDVGRAGGAVHSDVKQPVGRRMALQLLRKVYGRTDIIADGPSLARAPLLTPTSIKLSFRDANNLHYEKVANAVAGCAVSPFELGFANGTWRRAKATIAGTTVSIALLTAAIATGNHTTATGAVAASAASQFPTEVRYAWEGFPQCAIYAGTGGYATALPAAPFRVAVAAQCAPSQSRCLLGNVTISAYATAAQCCDQELEVCVPFGGCQAAIPKSSSVGSRE